MSDTNKCWTLPQLFLDLEARVKALEEKDTTLYIHNIYFEGLSGTATIGYATVTLITNNDEEFTSDELLEKFNSLDNYDVLMCTGFTASDDAIVFILKVGDALNFQNQDSGSVSFNNVNLISDNIESVSI